MIDAITVIRRMTTGDVATLPPYGRGVDIRFKTDSVVVIGFLPSRMEQVRQMAGRISRSLGRHRFLIVYEQPQLTPDTLENRLSGLDFFSVKSGIWVTKVMRGRPKPMTVAYFRSSKRDGSPMWASSRSPSTKRARPIREGWGSLESC